MSYQSNSEEQQYEVEKVVNKRQIKGVVNYLIKWRNYSSDYNSWETLKNLQNAKMKIRQYQKKLKRKIKKASRPNSIVYQLKSTDKEPQQAEVILCENPMTVSQPISKEKEKNTKNGKNGTQDKKIMPRQNEMIKVHRFNYHLDTWEQKEYSRQHLQKTTARRQATFGKQIDLAPIKILKTVSINGQRYFRFECKGKRLQVHHDRMVKYRPLEVIKYYEENGALKLFPPI